MWLVLTLTLTLSPANCVKVPCVIQGELRWVANEWDRQLVVEVESEDATANPAYRSYTVTLDGKHDLVHLMPMEFKGPGLYTIKITLKRANHSQEAVRKTIQVGPDINGSVILHSGGGGTR